MYIRLLLSDDSFKLASRKMIYVIMRKKEAKL